MKKLKVTGTATAMPTGILLGVVLCLVITLVVACLLAWLVNGGRLGMESLGYVICGIQLASSLIGTCVAAALVKHRRAQVCMMTGVGYFLSLLGCNALFFGGQYTGVGVSGLMILLGSVSAICLGLIQKRDHYPGKTKLKTG